MKYFWSAGVLKNKRCACRKQLRSCGFWGPIVDEFEREFSNESRILTECHNKAMGRIHLVSNWFPTIRSRGRKKLLENYAQATRKFYAFIGSIVPGPLIDSSKDPFYGRFLADEVGLNVFFVHISRPLDGVAKSRQNPKPIDPTGQGRLMPRQGIVQSTIKWGAANLLSLRVCANRQDAMHVRFEDLIATPNETVNLVATSARLPVAHGHHEVPLHTPLGNSARKPTKPVVLPQAPTKEPATTPIGVKIAKIVVRPLERRLGHR